MSYKKIGAVIPWALFCFAGVALNVIGARLVAFFHWPLFLDSPGTILVAAIGGYLPGIVTGYLSNLLNSVYDPISIFYCVTSVLIALAATALYQKGRFRKVSGLLLAALIFAFFGGGLGSVMGWALYGFDIASGVSGPLALRIYQSGLFPPFVTKLIADFLVDIADKLLTVLIVALALRFLPYRLERVLNVPLRRGPNPERDNASDKTPLRGLSLRTKITLLISGAVLLLAASATCITFFLYRRAVIDQHVKMGRSVAELAASVLDPDAIDRYLSEGESAEGYRETEAMLYRIHASSPDIQYVYVYRILPDGCHVVFDLDTDDVSGAEPGEIIAFDPSFFELIPALLAGEPIDPIISDDSYGWLLTVYVPVYNDAGECVCYAAADTSMETLRHDELLFMAQELSLFLGFFLLILGLTLRSTDENVISPINRIARAAGAFAYNSEEVRAGSLKAFRKLDIHTADEIENLYRALLKSFTDTVRYIADSQKKAAMISQMQSVLIVTLADLVESRDQNTGDHVRKTAAYVEVIMKQMKRDGVYADTLTDEFIEEVTGAAPLHDIGKINVRDAILNKPGRLTPEEFEEMKRHTTAGRDIISRVIAIAPDTGYLKQARNLAAFHHERWDGNGYPTGLAGEEIPISARIMAVADVFDALVSRRSYKAGFPFEKAVQIIREGSGSHFDPKIVESFLHAETEIRRVAEKFGESFTPSEPPAAAS